MAGHEQDFILSGLFITKSERIRVILNKECLLWESDNLSKSKNVVLLKHIIAVTPCDCSGYKQTKPVLCCYCQIQELRTEHSASKYVLPVNVRSIKVHYAVPSGRHKWKLASHVLQPLDAVRVKDWIDSIQDLLAELNRPKHLLIFINPYGGKKRGIKIYERKVLPILHLAGVDAHAVVTQRPNHAKEMIADIDILKYDGILCVGGDGMFSEILNSVLLKTQKEKGIEMDDMYNPLVVPRIPLGIIPAGSTNAAVNSITGSSDPLSATLLVVMGDITGIDLCGVYSAGRFLNFAITFLSYGYFGDIIKESEKLRWMGPKRYDYAGLKRILCQKVYEGELQLLVDVPTNQALMKNDRCCVDCGTCRNATHLPRSDGESMKKIRWLSLRGRFIAVNSAIISCSCVMSPKGISPSQHLGNGYTDVIVVKKCSRLNYLRYLLRTSYHHSDPFDLDFVKVYRVREFKFNPFVTDDKTPATGCVGLQDGWQEMNTSVWNCDGEIINEPSLSAKIHCQLLNVFGRGFEDRKTNHSSWSDCFKFLKRA
ncbi:ceramide kinase [Parasteatoda tepidariorum]|uniref:ceramide kinase n=1 Tax=Parasteatoda tepidariorum TaxID=114398 RepID=UPI000A2C0821|nr:ceramide kinase [Parasteatoda tepidariorum]